MVGETESMDMIETLNQEFDVVVNENEQLKKQLETLQVIVNRLDHELDTCKKHYSEDCPECCSCSSRIEYDEEFVVATLSHSRGVRTHRMCQDCIDDGLLYIYREWPVPDNHETYKFKFMNGSSEVDDS